MNLIPNIDVAVDINSLAPVFIDHILNVNDTNSRTFSVTLYANNQKISLYSGNFTAKAAISVNNILLDDDVTALIQTDSTVAVTVDNKYLTLIPGVMKIQLTITRGTDVIVTPLPILARVTSDLAQTAQILPDSHSSYSEIVAEIVAARGDYDNLAQALSHLMGFLSSETVDNATETGKVYYTTVGSSKALIVPVSGDSSQVQFRLDRDGKIYARRRSRSSTSVDFPAWGAFEQIGWKGSEIDGMIATYLANVKAQTITAQSTHDQIPTAKAVYDYAENNFLEVENNFIELTNHILDTVDYTRLNISFIESKHIRNDGVVEDYHNGGTTFTVSNEIDISQYDYLKINARAGWGDAYFAVYDENHSPIYVEVSPSSEIGVFNDNVILPENAHYLVISKLGINFDAYVSYPVFEAPTKKTQTITAQSTHDQIPTAKAVYDYAASKASYNYLNNQYTQLVNDVAQLPTTPEVQQMIDNSIGGVLSGEY